MYPETTPRDMWTQDTAEGVKYKVVDGNEVLLGVRVENRTYTAQPVYLEFFDSVSGERLADGYFNFPACYYYNFTLYWDTQGWAWRPDGPTPHSTRNITVQALGTLAGGIGSNSAPFVVVPKPVVLIHGWSARQESWGWWTSRGSDGYLRSAHDYWYGFAVGDGRDVPSIGPDEFPTPAGPNPFGASLHTGDPRDGYWHDKTKTLYENAQATNDYIEAIRKKFNAHHIDLVSHSFGGQIGRHYIQDFMPTAITEGPVGEFQRPVVHRYIQIAPSNDGSPCADTLRSVSGFGGELTPFEPATWEVSWTGAQAFNRVVNNQRGVPIDLVYAAVWGGTCHEFFNPGDSTISVTSARGGGWGFPHFATQTDVGQKHAPDQYSDATGRTVFEQIKSFLTKRRHLDAPSPPASVASGSRQAPAGVSTEPPALGDTFVHSSVSVPGTSSIDVAIPAPAGDLLTVSHFSSAGVGSKLFDPSGIERSSQAAQSLPMVQVHSVADPVVGNWRLTLENTNPSAVDVDVIGAIEGNPLALELEVGTPDQEGRTPIVATFTDNGSPVTDAVVEGTVTPTGGASSVELDFTSNGDGTYDVTTGRLPEGGSALLVSAQRGSHLRAVSDWVVVPRTYNLALTRSGPGSASVAEGAGPYGEGATVNLTATPKAGHNFSSWLVDGSPRTENPLQLTMTGDRKVVARFDLKTASTTSVEVARSGSFVSLSGHVDPGHAGSTVDARLYVKKGTRFKKVAEASVLLDELSNYATSLAAPAKGKCKVVVKFAGDADHSASKASKVFPCGAP